MPVLGGLAALMHEVDEMLDPTPAEEMKMIISRPGQDRTNMTGRRNEDDHDSARPIPQEHYPRRDVLRYLQAGCWVFDESP